MSFYLLELSIDSTDLIKRDFYIYDNLDKIAEKLRADLISNAGCYEAVWYGENIRLYIFENHRPKTQYDLHSRIIFATDQYPYIYFDSENKPIVLLADETAVLTDDDADFDEYFCSKVCNNDVVIDVRIDLSNIAPLEGKLVDKWELFMIPKFSQLKFHYGHNDLEFGNNISARGSAFGSDNEGQNESESDSDTYL